MRICNLYNVVQYLNANKCFMRCSPEEMFAQILVVFKDVANNDGDFGPDVEDNGTSWARDRNWTGRWWMT